MCRGELSAVITRLSVCEAGGSDSEELKKCHLPSTAALRFVNVRKREPTLKENHGKKNNAENTRVMGKYGI